MTTKIKKVFGQTDLFALDNSIPLQDNIILAYLPEHKEKLDSFLAFWEQSKFFALDIETQGTSSFLDALNLFRGKIRLIQVGLGDQVGIADLQKENDPRFFEVLKISLLSPNQNPVGHNIFFDLSYIKMHLGYECTRPRDTMVMGRMLQAGLKSSKNSLKALVKTYLGVEMDKSEQVSDWSLCDLSNSQINYAANDVTLTYKLFLKLCEECRKVTGNDLFGKECKSSFIDLVKVECDAISAFVELYTTGQPVDIAKTLEAIKQYELAMVDLYKPMKDKIGLAYSAQSAKMWQAIKQEYGIELRDDQGKNTTSSGVLFEAYVNSREDDLLRLSLVRSLKKTVDTLKNLLDSAVNCGGYARGSYTSLAPTASGRSQCKGGGKNDNLAALNLQNLPNHISHPLLDKYNLVKLRSLIKPKGAKQMFLYDLSSSHARYAASLSGDNKLVEILSWDDPHSLVTSKMAQLSGLNYTPEYCAANKKTDSKIAQLRQVAKKAIYTQFNGGGKEVFYAGLLGDFVETTIEECGLAQDALAIAFEGYTAWASKAKWAAAKQEEVLRDGYKYVKFRTPDGRLFHTQVFTRESSQGKPYKSVKAGEISSACFISPEAIAMKKALIDTHEWLINHRDLSCELNSFTHDDISGSDATEDKSFSKFVYNAIAYHFTESLNGVESSMSPDDGNYVKGFIEDYSQK